MSENDYREIFKRNLNHYMTQCDIKQADIVKALGVSKSIVSDWCKGEKIPRMDKIEMLSELFGIQKSDLIEETSNIENDVIIYSRDGKTVKKKFTKEQMDYLHKFIDSISDDDCDL